LPSGEDEESELPPPRLPGSTSTRFPTHHDEDDHTAHPEPEPESEPEPAAGGDKWAKPGSGKPTSSSKPEPRPRGSGAVERSWSLPALTSSLLISLVLLF
jgi:hypothetical protein